ncbi:MAG TPA: Clp protease N-terminal domain-containing protein [Gemmatimonadaceae bacterium]|nr:Clp protease N-terminal domain-containing protein [Gemmatimonadaceae bacterium]
MSSSNPARRVPIARDVRALPANPSLEYERKEAKALLRQLHAGDADALRRVRSAHPVALRARSPAQLQLADTHHVIAREYGFASWPKLVAYFEEMERHRNAPRYNSSDDGADRFEERARNIIRRHERGDAVVGQMLAHFVPRFYGRPVAEILATPVGEDDARLVVAREHRRVSWQELVERSNASRAIKDREGPWDSRDTPRSRARDAIRSHDIPALRAVLDAHPELVQPSVIDREWRRTLVRVALDVERDARTPEARRVTDFLASLGLDVQLELNQQLLGWPGPEAGNPKIVRWCLDRGADPNWMPPNGISVLEHAIARHRNGQCVDLIAQRVTARRAFWISAGLGDVDGVRRHIARERTLTAEARRHRADLMAMGAWRSAGLPPNPEADDLEIMGEAFQLAGWNGRWAVMDVLLEAGFPIDHDKPLGAALLVEAVGNMMVPLAEYLVSRGADLDRPWGTMSPPREMARWHVRRSPEHEDARRLVAICGAGTPEQILAELDSKRPSPPPPDAKAARVLGLAADDAARMGHSVVSTENMVVGILRTTRGVPVELFAYSGADMPRLRSLLESRLLPDADPLVGQELRSDAGAEAALRAAVAIADERHRESVTPFHLVAGIVNQGSEPGARLLKEVGVNEARIRELLKGVL